MKLQVVIDALNWICGLGPMCMMPIIMFVIGICLRVQISKLIKCCITTGVGFCGVNLVINAFIAQVGPSVQNMVKAFGLHTDIMDVGMASTCSCNMGVSNGCSCRICSIRIKYFNVSA